MKKHNLVAFTAVSFIFTLSAFEDKPALTSGERTALIASKAVGTAYGALKGAVIGASAGRSVGTHSALLSEELGLAKRYSTDPNQRGRIGSGVGAVAGGAVGGTAGYSGSRAAAIFALAKRHGVNFPVEKVSIFYDINLGQYRGLLLAAEEGNMERLIQLIPKKFQQRFGQDWQSEMQTLFEKYADDAVRIMTDRRKRISDKKKKFIRMVELGAAMANLLYKTNPNRKQAYNAALQFYQDLGLL